MEPLKVPEEFSKDLHHFGEMLASIDEDHVGLERMALMSALCDAANEGLLVTGVSGTGKSTVAFWVKACSRRNVLMPHGVTVNGLSSYSKILNNASTSVIVEDLARSGSDYMQVNTVAVLSGLAYTGFVEKQNQSVHLSINNCRMSALVYAQPLILKTLVAVNEFESDIKDKTLRYYHLVKPVDPKPSGLHNPFKYQTLDREQVTCQHLDDTIIDNLRAEVSKARAIEHTEKLLKASALINGRNETTAADVWIVQQLTRNFRLETYIYYKENLEGARRLNINLLPLFTMLLTYPKVTVKSIAQEYGGLSESRTKSILTEMGEWVLTNSNTVYPTKELKAILKECGY